MRRLRVGVIGCGLIAQVMHLPYLREMEDRFQIAALCDLSPGTVAILGDVYHVPLRHTRWEELLAEDLDAVLICTSGSHAQPAIAAARAGRHVFVEKPMCFSPREADAMIEAASVAGVNSETAVPSGSRNCAVRFPQGIILGSCTTSTWSFRRANSASTSSTMNSMIAVRFRAASAASPRRSFSAS